MQVETRVESGDDEIRLYTDSNDVDNITACQRLSLESHSQAFKTLILLINYRDE
jgi:hypothetical protein